MTSFLRPNENDFLLKQENSQWLHFSNPLEVFTTDTLEEVIPLLTAVQEKTGLGFHAAGFISYEAAPAFDSALTCHKTNFPLLWFGIYHAPEVVSAPSAENTFTAEKDHWVTLSTYPEYARQIDTIKEYIAAGNTYQVNHTIRLSKPSSLKDSWPFFTQQILPQDALFSAYWQGEKHAIASASPELFFQKEGAQITCRPMKGTRPRGATPAEDKALQQELLASIKDRAENVMILDMIRNDLGVIAQAGSVKARDIFTAEAYATVWQMTSTVEAETTSSIVDIFTALFPCSSITGAPKVETMRIIKELETEPRGIYTGCIGHIQPNQDARFNVAIRTAAFSKGSGTSCYGTGGGIVWDSSAEEEWQECITKTAILKRPKPDFVLFETLLYTPDKGFTLIKNHLERLEQSALHFGFSFSTQNCTKALESFASEKFCRVRLELSQNGEATLYPTVLGEALPTIEKPWKVALSTRPICSQNIFLAHKTSKRGQYSSRFVADYNDTLLYNEYGEITESTIANIVIEQNGKLFTPILDSGLLAGTFRRMLIEKGTLQEKRLFLGNILDAQKMWLINSVRAWIPVDITQFIKEYSTHHIPQKERT